MALRVAGAAAGRTARFGRGLATGAGRAAVQEPSGPVRVRFAPSPTGMLHLGGLRTALFNYLLARRYGGAFVLRIEDTDRKRLVPGAVGAIVDGLAWAGVRFDEGPHFQSQRSDEYRRHAQALVERGAAYRCFCGPARLEALRAEAAAQGRAPRYDRRCLGLSQRQIDERLRAGERFTVRLAMAEAEAGDAGAFHDAVHGAVRLAGAAGFDDAVLLKSDGLPTYHLANVVDDHAMGITHVLRGEEWLMSTPKHRALFRALGWAPPQYAHLPLLMNPDGSKLSKRNRDGPVQAYVDAGYLPAALVNYVALLGWHPGGTQELFTLPELEAAFTLAGLGRSKSTVSRDRLDWLNRQHLRRAIAEPGARAVLAAQARAALPAAAAAAAAADPAAVEHALRLSAGRLTLLRDLPAEVPFVFADPDLDAPAAARMLHAVPHATQAAVLRAALAGGSQWTTASFAGDVAAAALAPPGHAAAVLRHALTGQPRGPPLADVLGALPAAAVRRRLAAALARLAPRPRPRHAGGQPAPV
ncbi:Glutamate--tRNA ligase mitochondrial [Coemansia javaensis]|uniref:Glutamate--tRNA ligase, mitochondrial n=1 Tax=Coemansia javaensis TaxID=2761396 RepID=A0A9W8H9E2_9FUNG|nr:Glutamate--tRNA ligase mitochondrial [Coemansia javaensis]